MPTSAVTYGRPSGTFVLIALPCAVFVVLLWVTRAIENEALGAALVLAGMAVSFVLVLRLMALPVVITIEAEGIGIRPLRRLSIYPKAAGTVPWSRVLETRVNRPSDATAQLEVRTASGTFLLAASPAQIEQLEAEIAARRGAPAAPVHTPPSTSIWIRSLLWLLLGLLSVMTVVGVLQAAGIIHRENPFPWLRMVVLWLAALGWMALLRKRVRR
jgi:hypothetical protein